MFHAGTTGQPGSPLDQIESRTAPWSTKCFRTHCLTAQGTGVPSGTGLVAHGASEDTLHSPDPELSLTRPGQAAEGSRARAERLLWREGKQ